MHPTLCRSDEPPNCAPDHAGPPQVTPAASAPSSNPGPLAQSSAAPPHPQPRPFPQSTSPDMQHEAIMFQDQSAQPTSADTPAVVRSPLGGDDVKAIPLPLSTNIAGDSAGSISVFSTVAPPALAEDATLADAPAFARQNSALTGRAVAGAGTAVRTVEKVLGRPADQIPAAPGLLTPLLETALPARRRVWSKRWKNGISAIRTLLRACGLRQWANARRLHRVSPPVYDHFPPETYSILAYPVACQIGKPMVI